MTLPTHLNCPHTPNGWCLGCVSKLAAERDRLRVALAPFAAYAVPLEGLGTGQHIGCYPDSPTVEDCRRARAVLEGER